MEHQRGTFGWFKGIKRPGSPKEGPGFFRPFFLLLQLMLLLLRCLYRRSQLKLRSMPYGFSLSFLATACEARLFHAVLYKAIRPCF